jgi:hypothetical protein
MAKDKIEIEVMAKGLEKVKKDMKGLQDQMKKTGKESESTASILASGWFKAAAAITAAIAGVKKAMDFAKEGAKIQQTMDATAKAFGVSVDEMLRKLREASAGTISDADLIASANKMMALNVTTDLDKIAKALEIARARAKVMGLSATQAFEDLGTGVGRMSPLILDNLGLMVKGFAAKAKASGKAATSAELLNTVLEQNLELAKRVNAGTLTMAERFAKLDTTAKNLGDSFKRIWSAEILKMIENIGAKGEEEFKKVEDSMIGIRRAMRGVLALLTIIINSFILLGRTWQAVFSPMIGLIMGLAKSINTLNDETLNWKEKTVALAKNVGSSIKDNFEAGVQGAKDALTGSRDAIKAIFEEINILSAASADHQIQQIKKVEEAEKAAANKFKLKQKEKAQVAIDIASKTADTIFAIAQQGRQRELAAELAMLNAKYDNANAFTRQLEALDKQELASRKKLLVEERTAALKENNTRLAHEKSLQIIRINLEEQKAKRDKEIEEERQQAILTAKKKAFDKEQKASVARVIINAAQAFGKTLARTANPVLAGINAALVLGELPLIKAQKFPGFQRGTDFAPSGAAVVGEAGPEVVNLPQGAQVMSNEKVRETVNNSSINIEVRANDPITFVNELRQTYGLDVFVEA